MKTMLMLCLILLATFISPTLVTAKELIFTHSGHPKAKTVLIPLLEDIYDELGYQLTFQEAEGARALKLLNDGVVDGDVARLEPLLLGLHDAYPLVLLDTVQVVLYCRISIKCDNSILQNHRVNILIPTHDATLQLLTQDIKARQYFNSDWQNIITMFNAGKIDYLIWVESQFLAAPGLTNANKSDTSIGPFKVYHVLHKQHQALSEQVSKKLESRLAL